MTIADMKKGTPDGLGDQITFIYGLKPPEYAVYSTEKRLMVRYADDPTLDFQQRKGLAPLNPVRGEINGLIDGWRVSKLSALRGRSVRYDRLVADALVVALEHDVDSAAAVLNQIKQDIIEDRTSWARLEYLLSALFISLVFIAFVWGLLTAGVAFDLWRAAAAGALGAFFSIALTIRTRTILLDLRRISNITDASLRILIGVIGASVLMALVSAKAVTVSLGSAFFPSTDPATTWLMAIILGFLAGFSERLVPDLLSKASATTQAPPPQAKAMPAAAAGKAEAAGSAATAKPSKPADDPAPQEASLDHCVCDVELAIAEVTQDTELPAASGGVASAEGEQPK